MAQYDAGSIEATLRVNEEPFDQGLRHAQERARAFEDGNHDTNLGANMDTAKIDEEIAHVRAKLAELSDDGGFSIRADVDDAHAREEIDALRAKLAELKDKRVTVRVNTEESRSEVDRLRDAIGDEHGGGKSGGGGGGGGSLMKSIMGMTAKIGLLGTVGAGFLDPLIGTAIGLGSAFGIAGLGVGAFGITAKADMTDLKAKTDAVTKAQQELTNATTDKAREKAIVDLAKANAALTGPARLAAEAQLRMKGAIDETKKATAGPVYGALTQGMNAITKLMPIVTPLINASANAVSQSIGQISNALQGPGFKGFVSFLSKEIGPVLHSLTGSLINLGAGIGKMFENAMPVINEALKMFEKMTAAFSHMTGSPEFADFMVQLAGAMRDMEPVVGKLFGIIGDLITETLPLVQPVMAFMSSLLDAVASLIGPLAKFFGELAAGLQTIGDSGALDKLSSSIGSVLAAIGPLIGPFAHLVSVLLPGMLDALDPVISAVKSVADVIGPLVDKISSLIDHLGPLKDILGGVLDAWLAWKLAMKVGWIADVVTAVSELGIRASVLAAAEWLASAATTAWSIASGIAAGVMTGLGVAVDFALGPIGLIIIGIAALVAAAWAIIHYWGPISKFFEKLWKDVSHFFENLWHDVSKFVSNLWHDVSHWFHNLWDDITGFVSGIYHDVVDWFKKMGTKIKDALSDAWDAVSGWFKALPGHIKDFFASAASWLAHAGKSIITGLWNGLKSVWDSVSSWFHSLGGHIKNFFSGAASWLGSAGHSVITGLWGGIKAVWNSVGDWFRGIPGKIKGFFSGAIDWLGHIGEMIVEGLKRGIEGAWDKIKSWFKDKVKGFIDDAKHGFGLWSPSKEFHYIGSMIGAGMHNGLIEGFVPVNAMMDDQVEAMKKKFSGVQLATRASYTVATSSKADLAAQAAAEASRNTADEIASLRDVLKSLAADTGKEVGQQVGSKFDKAIEKQQHMATVARRQGG